ncbi:hypothetical protein AURDEDRAFT_177143 [Auricularia subglabra TFB-10046 SS5]|uniref:Uncharacterized protein n=1 Tax=Auricularia subglabra (strain TFB-10046 / SS5) TaxID=717982 RepID=J0WN34_AURST|nr:hypothetical protein AURDEDRAFT_177143 [Auricularia subglabra TFB-10046 SS5]
MHHTCCERRRPLSQLACETVGGELGPDQRALKAHLCASVLWLRSGGLGAFGHRSGFIVTTGHSPPASRRRPASPTFSLFNSSATPFPASSQPTGPPTAHLCPAVFWLLPGALGASRHRDGSVVPTGHSPLASSRRPANPAHSRNDFATPCSIVPAAGDVDSLSRGREFAVGGELEPDQRVQRAAAPRRSLATPWRPGRVSRAQRASSHRRPLATPKLPGAFGYCAGIVVTTGHSPPRSSRHPANPARSINQDPSPVVITPAAGEPASLSNSRARPSAASSKPTSARSTHICAPPSSGHGPAPWARLVIAAASSSPPATALQHPAVVQRAPRAPEATTPVPVGGGLEPDQRALNAHLLAAVFWLRPGALDAFGHRGGLVVLVVTTGRGPPPSSHRPASLACSRNDDATPRFSEDDAAPLLNLWKDDLGGERDAA